ncbi:sensor histidine kinase [Nocardia sp. NPDC003345]
MSDSRTVRWAGRFRRPAQPPLPHPARWVPVIALAAVTLFTVVLHTLLSDTPLPDGRAIGLALVQGISLLVAPRLPGLAWAGSTAALTVASLWAGAGPWVDAMFNSYLVVLGVVAMRVDVRAAAGAWAATVVAGSALAVVAPPGDGVAALVETAVLAGLAVIAGAALRALAAARHSLEGQRAAARTERDRAVLLRERARIARELHDMVAHHMSVIAIQSEAARYRDPEMAPQTAAGLATIHDSAVTALADMRRILDVLRSGDTGNLPQPALSEVGELVESVRATGAAVALSVTGDTAAPGRARGLSSYRIVQEALSNAVRHAPGAAIAVGVAVDETEIHVVVENEAPARAGNPAAGPGHGLLGMRERITMLGGALDAGPTVSGGYRVVATLPTEDPHR